MTTQRENTDDEESFKEGNVSEACLNDVLETVLDVVDGLDSTTTRTAPVGAREFRASALNVLHMVRTLSGETKPVTVAIDIVEFDARGTTAIDDPDKLSHAGFDPDQRSAKLGVISVVSTPAPVFLGFEVVDADGTDTQSKLPNIGDVTRSLLEQASDFVEIETVLADETFLTDQVLAELDQRDLRNSTPAQPSESVTRAHIEEQTAALRSRLSTKSLPAGPQGEDYWAAAIDVNAHSLTHYLLSKRLEPGEHYFLSFDRFLQSLRAQRAERIEGEEEDNPDDLRDGGQFSPEERMEWFCREIKAFTEHKVELDESEVTVSIVDPSDTFTIDFEPTVDAGLSYGLILTEGLVGNHTAELHFQPQETVDPAYHELQNEPSGESLPHIPPAVSERTYHGIMRVRQRWGVPLFEAYQFLGDVGFLDS